MPEENNVVTPAPAPAPDPVSSQAPARDPDALSREEMSSLMGYDPFSDEGVASTQGGTIPTTTEPAAAVPSAAPSVVTQPQAPGGSPQTLTEPAAAAPQEPNVATALNDLREFLQAQTPAQPAPAPAAPTADPAQQLETRMRELYSFQLPPATVAQLTSEDPAQVVAGVTHITQQIGALVHRNVLKDMQELQARIVGQQIPQMLFRHQQLQAAQTQINTDFYGNFPDLNRRELIPLVQATSKEIFAEGRHRSYSAEFRNELGKRVRSFLISLTGQAPAQAPTPPPAPRPNTVLPGNTTRMNGGTPSGAAQLNSPDDIYQTLFGNFN